MRKHTHIHIYIYIYIYIYNIYFDWIKFSRSGHFEYFEYFLKPCLCQNPFNPRKLIFWRYIGFSSFNKFNMVLTVPTLFSFSNYYLKGRNCWECNFSLNLFSRNILGWFYPWRYFRLSRDLIWFHEKHMTSRVRSSHYKSPTCHVLWPLALPKENMLCF